jgi:hypothetical protein
LNKLEAFFHDFKQDFTAGAEVNQQFRLETFMETIAAELEDMGIIHGFDFAHYRAQKGMRIDGYFFNDDGLLELFITDFDDRQKLESLTRTDTNAIFKRGSNFLKASLNKYLYQELEESSQGYGLSREIHDRKNTIRRVNFFLFSERLISDQIRSLDDENIDGITISYQIWDISRLERVRNSAGHKEPLDIIFSEFGHEDMPCLNAGTNSSGLESYLVVVPGFVLADLYEKYGARLLEQNVRCFLQARGNVNKGIRKTIIEQPEMFFSYNNGITATAESLKVVHSKMGTKIQSINDLQIVNGGQTTASLFHTRRKDKASLENVFVQMKLSVVKLQEIERIVPLISEYANTQNKVNAADFFSNHPFHIRMESFSRRVWAPAADGELRETKWFYERARGQFADAQSTLTKAEKKKFLIQNPKKQKFDKNQIAKYENVWDEHPRFVNLGNSKNFSQYAKRIGKEWKFSESKFNEDYYKRLIARVICFKTTEQLVSKQEWYTTARANIVAYTLALVSEICKNTKYTIDHESIWKAQSISLELKKAILKISKIVNIELFEKRPPKMTNTREYAKKDICWENIRKNIPILISEMPDSFYVDLIALDEQKSRSKSAKKIQNMDDLIAIQSLIVKLPVDTWRKIKKQGLQKRILTPKEMSVVDLIERGRLPSEKQSLVLYNVLEKARREAIIK